MDKLPLELKEYIYDYVYDFSINKERVLKELKSFIVANSYENVMPIRFARIARNYFKKDIFELKPSSIKGNYHISYA